MWGTAQAGGHDPGLQLAERAIIGEMETKFLLTSAIYNGFLHTQQLFHILYNFQYDNLSMELMLYEGLMPMLVRELNDYLTSDDEHHKRRRDERLQGGKKRKLTDPTTPETLSKVFI